MDCREAMEVVVKHLATLYENDGIYDNDTNNLIYALGKFAIPAMEKEIEQDVVLKTSVVQYGREYYACPNCGDYIKWRYWCSHDLDNPYREPGRCPDCGQTLNWEGK